VRDIKQTRFGACVVVLGHQAHRVLDWHAVAGKGHHAGAKLDVQSIERGREQSGVSGQLKSPRAK
jgi:hypothetical protein